MTQFTDFPKNFQKAVRWAFTKRGETAPPDDQLFVPALCMYEESGYKEMLEALKDAEEWLVLSHGEPPTDHRKVDENHRTIERIRAAIRKAEGVQP